MGQVARWNDAILVPERGLTLSSAVDASLRDRVHSLVVSRNQKNPPCPSPDPSFSCRGSEGNRLTPTISTKGYNFGPAQAAAQLAWFENRVSDMGATRFDGPAGQIEDNKDDVNGRRPSQPEMSTNRRLSGDWLWSSPTSGLNQRAHGDIVGREASVPTSIDRKKSSASRKSNPSRLPRFHLRTVPPATDVNNVSRPSPLHVPGSYRSEVDGKKGHELETMSTALKNTSETSDDGVLATPYHAGLTNEHSHPAAVDALKGVVKQNSYGGDRSAPTPEPLKLKDMVEKSKVLPQESFTGEPVSDQAGESAVPVPHYSGGKVSNGYETPIFVISNDQDEDSQPPDGVPANHDNDSPVEKAPLLDGPQISDLLANLPPMKQTTSYDVVDVTRSANATTDAEKVRSSVNSSLEPNSYSVAQNQDKVVTNPVSPQLTEANDEPPSVEAAVDHDEATLPLISESRRSSQAAARFSSVSRAMSLLSEMSARSGLKTPSLRSSGKYTKIGSTSKLTARPRTRSQRKTEEASSAKEADASIDRQSRQGTNDSRRDSSVLQSQQNHGEGFTKVITDLESVLKEALNIAGQAPSSGHSKTVPLSSQVRRKGYSRTYSDTSISSSECLSSSFGGIDEEDNTTTLPRDRTRQEQVLIKEPEHGALYHGHYKKARDATPYPVQSRHASTVPATDKAESKSNRQSARRNFLEVPRTSSKASNSDGAPLQQQASFSSTDWAVIRVPSRPSKLRLEVKPPPPAPQTPPSVRAPVKEQHTFLVRDRGGSEDTRTRTRIREYVDAHQRPPVQPRLSSRRLRAKANSERIPKPEELNLPGEDGDDGDGTDCECVPYVADFETSGLNYHPVFQGAIGGDPSPAPRQGHRPFRPPQDTLTPLHDDPRRRETSRHDEPPPATNTYSLEGRHHFSIREPRGFSLSRSHRRSPIARDWSTSRKRYTATVVCITTAFVGLIIGIYAGEVPAIQYAIADEHHYTILGNVLFFIGMAITTALFYPLPLLHGRKPYTLGALAILLPLQFPQALAIETDRNPYVATYRVGLLVPRVFAGIVMGFANINFITTLLDLYGASLQSGNPHQETVSENDVRRHGGGMGVWLSIWTWCYIGSLGLGFLIGAEIISGLNVSWGFWILIILNAAVLLLNIVTPEVRRSAYRRSMAEVRSGGEVSRRVARGEIKMHLESTGPVWFWEELIAGHVLAFRMLVQPGFAVLALYQGWIYGQVVLVIVLLGALLSRYYYFHPQYVGLAVGIIPLGALLAVPFQKASLFSRSRHHPQRTDSMTFQKRVTWTSHLVRRAIFMVTLPFAGLAYTLASGGPPTHYMVPIIFAGSIGFLSNLAIAECNGLIMETFDTSDLQPGMTGRPRRVLPEEARKKRTNFSCFPRVTAGFAIAQTFAFSIGAAATAWGGVIVRHVGAQTATAVMAGVLLVLTLLLLAALWRFKTVQIIPSERFGTNILSGPEDEWKPVIIGNPSGTTRRMSLLELGNLSRWSEIRRRNKLAPEQRTG